MKRENDHVVIIWMDQKVLYLIIWSLKESLKEFLKRSKGARSDIWPSSKLGPDQSNGQGFFHGHTLLYFRLLNVEVEGP